MDLEEYEQDIEEQSDGDYEPDEDEIDRDEDYDIEMELEDQLERGTESPEENTELQTISLSELLDSTNPARSLRILASLLRAGAHQEAEDNERYGGSRHCRYGAAKEPDQRGVELLNSGAFGTPEKRGTRQPIQKALRDAKRRLDRPVRSDMFKDIVPNTMGTVVARYGANVYAGQFSNDSSFYYTCVQDFRLHIYDTKASLLKQPHIDEDHQSLMKHKKTIHASPGGWTITDSHLSPDNTLLAYAIMSPTVFVASVHDGELEQRSLFFGQNRREYEWHDRYGVWSCRFSANGKELVAGGTQKIMVYDLEADRRTIKIEAHSDDVNSCCWADSSANILISASDDSFIKVWDRRSLGSSHRPSGVFIGHTEGITYVSPKNDGRYVISNGKDQTLKLWDLRKMQPYSKFCSASNENYGIPDFDYRNQEYPYSDTKHPDDCSVMSYRGHSVLRTLIRCNFSPAETTGSRYIYSGSADGIVHIWSLDGTLVQKIDRRNVRDMGYHPSDTEKPADDYSTRPLPRNRRRGELPVVRDVAWHTQEPVLMTCSWGTYQRPASEVAKHEWKGLNKLGGRLEDFVEREQQEATERQKQIPKAPSGWTRGRWY